MYAINLRCRKLKDKIRRSKGTSDDSGDDKDTDSDSDSDTSSDGDSDSSDEDGSASSDPATVELVRGAYDFEAGEDNELDLHVGDMIAVLEKHESGYAYLSPFYN